MLADLTRIIIGKVANGAEEEHSVHGHSTLPIAGVVRKWLVVWIECNYMAVMPPH